MKKIIIPLTIAGLIVASTAIGTIDDHFLGTSSAHAGTKKNFHDDPYAALSDAFSTYHGFDNRENDQIEAQLRKYSEEWIEKLRDDTLKAEAYHQYAYTLIAKLDTYLANDCVKDANNHGSPGAFCGSYISIDLALERNVKENTLPKEYKNIAYEAKKYSDKSIELNPCSKRHKNLNKAIQDQINVIEK